MGEITTTAGSVYRDLQSPGNPGLGEHDPIKAEIRALFALVDESIAGSASGPKAYATYAAMAADVPQDARQFGIVSTEDGGTHTDPVTGATVDNAGYYSYSISPAGWQWIFPVTAEQSVVQCTASDDAGIWTVSPRSGYSLPSDVPGALFVFVSPADIVTSAAIQITGFNVGDPRVLVGATGSAIEPGQLVEGATCVMRFRGYAEDVPNLGQFELLSGAASAAGGSGTEESIVKLYPESRTNNSVLLAPAPGQVLKNNTAFETVFMWQPTVDATTGQPWLFRIVGVNDLDAFPLVDRAGVEISPTSINAFDVVFFGRNDGAGAYEVLQIWSADGGGSGSSTEQLLAAQGAAERAKFAEAAARKPRAPGVTLAQLADISPLERGPGALLFVSDATGGSVLAFSDGTDWRRSTDRTVVN